MRPVSVVAVVVALGAAAFGCGESDGDDSAGDGASALACDRPDSLSLKVAKLEAERANCATVGAVSLAASECFFDSGATECPAVEVGGTRWDCSFQITGSPGSGGLSEGVCLRQGGPEVRFEVQLTGD